MRHGPGGGGSGLPGLPVRPGNSGARCAVAGDGTPPVAEDTVAALAAALGVSYRSALGLVADALEMAYRLPRVWELVQTGRLSAWRARQVAAVTPGLSRAAVGFVDRQVAVLGARGRVPGPAPLRGLVHEALCRFDPEVATEIEDTALVERDVTFDHTESTATTRMVATLDTLDAMDLDATISNLSEQMARLGDTDPRGVRRAHALGLLARPDRVLALFPPDQAGTPKRPRTPEPAGTLEHASTPDRADTQGGDGTQVGATGRIGCGPVRATTLYVHVTAADLAVAGATGGAGRVERLGTTTLTRLHDWLARSERITVRPVLDPTGTGRGSPGRTTSSPDPDGGLRPVDTHDPPVAMRETVILRDGHCVFPGCTVDARVCDLDHIEPYVPLDEGGPPGQTRPHNLACLCRRHHRLKTFTAWDYRPADQHARGYTWSSPHGHTYLTHPTPKR